LILWSKITCAWWESLRLSHVKCHQEVIPVNKHNKSVTNFLFMQLKLRTYCSVGLNTNKHIINMDYRCIWYAKKNKELRRSTSSFVPCLILKLFLRLDKLRTNGLNKNWNSCPPLNHETIFCSLHKLSKLLK
jgi:hypothetical protein